MSERIYLRVNFADGNHLSSGFNGTLAEAKRYYVGQSFTFGGEDFGIPERSVLCTDIQLITENEPAAIADEFAELDFDSLGL